MWIAWLLTPKTKLVVAIVDKTVLTSKGQEHISLNWVLNHEKFTKTSEKMYEVDHDYFGFFPQGKEKFKLKGLERFSNSQLNQLSNDADLVYFTDTYGIYNNEWFKSGDINERSGMLYGGLSNNDMEILRLMKEKKKPVIAEFNTIGSPTKEANRRRFEEMFQLKWTGWTARYFDNLDIRDNAEIPAWLINNYKKDHHQKWPFTKPGIAFVNNEEKVVILEKDTDLTDAMPYIVTTPEFQETYGLPNKIKYLFWFDIMVPNYQVNKAISNFEIKTNKAGEAKLIKNGIPLSFPAVTTAREPNSFFYFSGDFADNPVSITSSYFKMVELFKGFFYDERNTMERGSFFWNYYKPLLSTILETSSEAKN